MGNSPSGTTTTTRFPRARSRSLQSKGDKVLSRSRRKRIDTKKIRRRSDIPPSSKRTVQLLTFSTLDTFEISNSRLSIAAPHPSLTKEEVAKRKKAMLMEAKKKAVASASANQPWPSGMRGVVRKGRRTASIAEGRGAEKGMAKDESVYNTSCSKMCETDDETVNDNTVIRQSNGEMTTQKTPNPKNTDLVDRVPSDKSIDCSRASLSSSYTGMLPPLTKKEFKSWKMTLVLDMDETLLHSEFETVNNSFRQSEDRRNATRKPDFEFIMGLAGGTRRERVRVYKRPGVEKFLTWCAKHFEVVIFTAAIPEYASPVLDMIDPDGRISHRLYRDSTCMFRGHPYVKDLSLLGRKMDRIVLVDNNPMAMIASPDNAVPIPSFYDDILDNELYNMQRFLAEMCLYPDVRPFLQQKFGFRELIERHLKEHKQR